MKILHVINGLSVTRGGPSATLAALVPAQVKRGHEVVVLSTIRQPPPLTLKLGQHGALTVHETATTSESKWYNPRVLSEVRRWARDCDIVHVHGSWRYHLQAAAKVSREYSLPYIVRPAGNLGVISSGHKWYLKWPYFFLFERRVFDRAAAIHCTSHTELEQMAPLGLRARKFIVPNAVVIGDRTAAPSESSLMELCPQLKPHQKVVLYLGRITWIKRLDALVDGFIRIHQRFPDWCLIVAGTLEDPRIVEDLRQRAEKNGISERLMMPGTILGEAKAALFRRAAIFAQPSLHENFGASVAEALGYGLPCVVSRGVAMAPDVLEAGAGLICESEPNDLAACLERLMSDPESRAQCGGNALQLAARFQPENVAALLDIEYLLCIKNRDQAVCKDPANRLPA